MPVPFKVKAIYEYKSENADDLSFSDGQIITVTEEEDEDWYTGEYIDASGTKLDGIFPRNFVEKYEPAIPTRPNRSNRKSVQPELLATEPEAQPGAVLTSPPQSTQEARIAPQAGFGSKEPAEEPFTASGPPRRASQVSTVPTETKPTARQPPAVAEKPTTSSFRDRIAAFNKPAAAPVAPFKPSNASQGGSGFVKKAFVAPPPSRNAYVPPPSQPAPQKVYRREEDPALVHDEDEDVAQQEETARQPTAQAEDQPKPTSLKDRIALLQQQQLEQAARHAEKKKVKKPPPPRRTDSADTLEEPTENTEVPISRRDTGDTLGRVSIDARQDEELELVDTVPGAAAEKHDSTFIPPPSRELVSDTNDADDSEAADMEDAHDPPVEDERGPSKEVKSPLQLAAEESKGEEAEDEEDTEDEDPEIRRRRELRERMAKMSGGMGMMGMFGPPGGMPTSSRRSKASRDAEQPAETDYQEDMARAPPVPIMALPGMAMRPKELEREVDDSDQDETAMPTPMETGKKPAGDDDYMGQSKRTSIRSPPMSPEERSAPLPPRDTRAIPPIPGSAASSKDPQSPPPRAVPPPPPVQSNLAGNEDDGSNDEIEQAPPASAPPVRSSVDRRSSTKINPPSGAPPVLPNRSSIDEFNSATDKRASRAPPPPVPGTTLMSPTARAPPPPPPGQPPSRTDTSSSRDLTAPRPGEEDIEEEVTEYEGDYDTDIASGVKHKDALKAHNRDSSIDDEGTLTDDAMAQGPPSRAVPPLPRPAPTREVPPPPPQSAPKSRKSTDVPRGLPPPVPTTRPDDEEYDPYKYSTVGPKTPSISSPQSPPLRSPGQEREDVDPFTGYSYSTTRALPPMPSAGAPPSAPVDRAAPPPPPADRGAPPLPPSSPPSAGPPNLLASGHGYEANKKSLDVSRQPTVRRSMDVSRASVDQSFIASDIDLGENTGWWVQENTPPPSLQGRSDVLYEIESNTTTKRGGKTTVIRDVYVLWMDYSQTTINVSFDPSDPQHASLQQTHERPPPPPRQDQLESASDQLGTQIANAAQAAQGNTIADGLAHSFVAESLQALRSSALLPVGTRAYGALVYANLANASTQQFDAIRPGDIVTFRNAKFAGHKGGLHTKYSMDVGKPDHAAIVIDWDGTKKKIRAWEQGRDDKGKKSKVKEESFRVGDLKSGEVRVWRVMPRTWVGWNTS